MELVLSAAAVSKRTLRRIFKATFRFPWFKVNRITTPKRDAHTAAVPLYKSVSCSELTDGYRTEDKTQFINDSWLKARSATNFAKPFVIETVPDNVPKYANDRAGSDICIPRVFESIANVVCPCPCPCPCGPCCSPCGPCCGNMADCNCGRLLPPPCNTPPKCIQYMQGYYYYPYGTWFCGPYHVNTGAVPVCGPVCPGTTCGIAPPNPNLLCKCGPCCCGLLSCSICNPPPFSPGPGGAAPTPWGHSPNITSCYGVPGIPNTQFGGLGAQGSPAMSTQGIFPPCIQDSWGQPQPMGQSSLPIPFGLPGSTAQTPMPGGAGFNITFPPVQISPPQAMPNSLSYPTAPQWAAQHAPCDCAGCVAKRSQTETKSPAPVDTPAVMQSIIEPFSKVFPASKPPVNVAENCKERRKHTKILEDPKVKASVPW